MAQNDLHSEPDEAFIMRTSTDFEINQALILRSDITTSDYTIKAACGMSSSSSPLYGTASTANYVIHFYQETPDSFSSFSESYASISGRKMLAYLNVGSSYNLYYTMDPGYSDKAVEIHCRTCSSCTNYYTIVSETGYDTYMSTKIHGHDDYAWFAYIQQSKTTSKFVLFVFLNL